MKQEGFIEKDFCLQIAVDGARIRPRSSRDREQQQDNMDTRRPTRDNKRRQEFLK